ncbi:hypothetical protein KX729_09105 [Rhizobium sp. XQZ8]|uniref:hypothetical protein n=1 Tax=Rhizobium populisoli TaxID=2859785 RepID=UPI001CA4F0A8|nr:hypothetical protein [Rhizobium populisoli]MBW6421596.1 hypothetical protein [Rhizobium populisoli]
MAGFSKTLMVSTDVAHIVLFHPDDLAHAREWPIAWYSEPFIFPAESAAGRLIGWCTGSDGGFAVRITDGPLTEREERYCGPRWTFPYRVRHGRVFIDNTDTLPGVEQMTQPSENEEFWIDIPDGDYAVTVTAVEWSAEPGARDDGFEPLPNYVVQFQPGALHEIKPAKRPPDLDCLMEATATDEIYRHTPKPPKPIDFDRHYPAFASLHVARAGQEFSTQGEALVEAAVPADADTFALFDIPFVVAADLAPGAPAVIAICHGSGGVPDQAVRYSFRSRQAVQIAEITGMFAGGNYARLGTTGLFRRRPKPVPSDALAAVRISPLPASQEASSFKELDTLRTKVLDDVNGDGPFAKQLGGLAGYEALRLAASEDRNAVLDWLIDNLPLAADDRLRLSILPPSARCDALSSAYDAHRLHAV